MTTPNGVDRGLGEGLAQGMLDLYSRAETQLAADIARRLSASMDSPDWDQRKLAGLGDLRRWTQTLLQRLGRETEHEITQALLLAYMRGGSEAMRAIAALQNTLPEWLNVAGIDDPNPRIREALAGKRSELDRKLAELQHAFPGITALMRIVSSLTLRIAGTHLPVLRWAEDAYREVIARTALPDVTLGLVTRRRAAQVAWEHLLSRGITGFTDRRGRNWELASYVEMAVRTGVAQASVEGHLDRLTDAGIDLVMVSNAPQECERCRRWEGTVLARSGPSGYRTVEMVNAVTGRPITVEVHGTVDEAIAAGLMHPNCRHRFVAYLPGATRRPTHVGDPEGDAARQRLRELERKVRREKLQAAAAIDPAAAAEHRARVRELQAQIREHVDATAHLGIMRKPGREQIGIAR